MLKCFLFNFVILLYGRIYYETLDMKAFGIKDPPDMVKFKALALTALLLSLNIMTFIFFIVAFLRAIGLETPSWMEGRFINIALILSIVALFLFLRKLTAGFDSRYDQIKNAENSKLLLRFVAVYQYFVFGFFVVSIIALVNT